MAQPAALRFRFDFDDLRTPEVAAEVPALVPAGAVPSSGTLLVPGPRPWWLPRLLPRGRFSGPLAVTVIGEAAPGFAWFVLAALSSVVATAGAAAGLRVWVRASGLLVAPGGSAPEFADPLCVVAADLAPASLELAQDMAQSLGGAVVIVLNGGRKGRPQLAGVGVHVVHLPAIGPGDLRRVEADRARLPCWRVALAARDILRKPPSREVR